MILSASSLKQVLGVMALVLLTQSISFADESGSITLENGNYISDVGGSGVLVSPYPAVATFGSLANVPVYVTCLNFYKDSTIGTTYKGTFNTTFATFTQADVETSYLLDTFLNKATTATVSPTIASDISYAVWQIQDPSVPIPAKDQPLVSTYISDALAAYKSGYVADNYIFTPNVNADGSSSQSYMIIPPGSKSLGFVPTAPGAPAPPLTACFAFAGVLILQSLRNRKRA